MRIVGLPEESDLGGSILPVTIADVDFDGTPEELRTLSDFFLKAAAQVDVAQATNSALRIGVELGNSSPTAKVGLWVKVVRQADE
jgi:hypothetical protein